MVEKKNKQQQQKKIAQNKYCILPVLYVGKNHKQNKTKQRRKNLSKKTETISKIQFVITVCNQCYHFIHNLFDMRLAITVGYNIAD